MEKVAEIRDFKSKHGTYDVDVYKTKYADDYEQTALIGLIAETDAGVKTGNTIPGEEFATFSINGTSLNIHPQSDNNVLIKNYSENEGFVDELVKHGVIAEPENRYTINHFGSKVYEAELLV